jgi:hypothetical protein
MIKRWMYVFGCFRPIVPWLAIISIESMRVDVSAGCSWLVLDGWHVSDFGTNILDLILYKGVAALQL